MRLFSIFAVAITVDFCALSVQAENTNDPISHFVARESLSQEDVLYLIRVDINNDGYEDTLISSSYVGRQYPKGHRIWDYYLSDSGNGYWTADLGTSPAMILANWRNYQVGIDEIGDKTALLRIGYANAAKGSLWAYYFEGNQLRLRKSDSLQFKQLGDKTKNTQMLDRVLERATVLKTESLKMEQALSREAFNALVVE